MRRVVITGLGPITSVGIGKKAFWESLQAARSGIGTVTSFDPSIFNVHSASEIKDWFPERYFPPRISHDHSPANRGVVRASYNQCFSFGQGTSRTD